MQLREIPKPVPTQKEALIKTCAATVTAGDCQLRRFDMPALFWLPMRLVIGITKPRKGIFGQELAGVVESVGSEVRKVKKGDHVFAFTALGMGAYAEYICLSERHLTTFNPAKMTCEAAATIPTGGINGLHFIKKANIREGEKVLINGAGGSIGTYALQFAKAAGAIVTAVDSNIKLAMLRALGADEVIDYKQDDFTRMGKIYEVIIDVAGTSSYSGSLRCLAPHGRYVLGNPSASGMMHAMWTSMTNSRKVMFELADYKSDDLIFVRDRMESGEIKPVMDKYFPFDQIAEAHRYVEAGLKCGNVVIKMES